MRPTSVWHVPQLESKICVWIIDKVGAAGALGVVGLLLPHAPEAMASRSALRVRPDRVAVIGFFTSSSDLLCVE
ncbi:MAG: hypothetical protein AUH72_22420 [Acidobacteria bacterium 13_1_40CM_4_65_8]|nr:MAG: hypothetical protein AUH72_22420 [Acidobacteria bacterium 13_1_40CM_4_65_8]